MRHPMLIVALFSACILFGIAGSGIAHAEAISPYEYVSPRPGAVLVSPRTTIVVRQGEPIEAASVSESRFHVEATRSGVHSGRVALADDGRTIIFTPDRPFERAETVRVTIGAGLATVSRRVLPRFDFGFTTWPDEPVDIPDDTEPPLPSAQALLAGVTRPTALPADYPAVSITVPTTNAAGGYLFLSNLSNSQGYLLILDPVSGEPFYYKALSPFAKALDFKRQPNGLLTYFDSSVGVFYGMDSSYAIVRTYDAGNGYRVDHHDLQVLPNGHYLVLIWDAHVVDMSKIVAGGQPAAFVIGLVVQELDAADHVLLEWRSWDHVAITETSEDLTAQRINYMHGNALEADYDGNILITARNLDQVIKIDRQTGAFIWRLGGQKNQFDLRDDTQWFHRPHDARRLPTGNITLFDNREQLTPYYSRAIEYRLDETARTVTRVWEYRNTPDVYSPFLANAQRLPNGNTLIGWGLELPVATEVRPDGTKELEFSFASAKEGSYRVFRFPWVGLPPWPPTLALEQASGKSYLYFSWNGATEILSYRVMAGAKVRPDTVIAETARTGFETSLDITEALASFCSFQVMPLDRAGRDTVYSNVVRVPGCVPRTYLPMMLHR